MAKEVLEELPRQVEEYYQIMNMGPDRLKDVQAKKGFGILPPLDPNNPEIPYFQSANSPYKGMKF